MEINYLRDFVILASTSNFMEAANILYSSQSTLSKHLMKIESELGLPLFDRTTRKVEISEFGKLFLPIAKQIVELQDQYIALLQNRQKADREILTLGTIPALAEYKITDILVNFKKSRPQSTVNVIQAGTEELREMLRHKKCTIAFTRDTDEVPQDLIIIPYTVDTMVAVLPATHPFAKQKTISLKILEDEDFLLSEKQTMLYNLSIRACKECGFEPKVALTDHKIENILDLVIKGMGIALMMKQSAFFSYRSEAAIVEITPPITTRINLCHLKNVELTAAAKHFIHCTESQKTLVNNRVGN
jgi:LysR family transcriptional regulator, transcription activator of glutamate synthase operon